MSMDVLDIEWRCGCGHANPDCEDSCRGCGQKRYVTDCTTAVEERLGASLARQRLLKDLATHAGNPVHNADVQTMLDEVDDLTKRLRSATRAMQQAVSAIDNEQYHARVRVAKDYLENQLLELEPAFGTEE